MWERDKVDWGRQGRSGSASFNGVMVGNKNRKVSFLDQMGTYVLYDRFEQPVQIGQSNCIFKRLRQHRKDHLRNRWASFTWFGFFKVGANNNLLSDDRTADLKRQITLKDALDELEAILIQVLEPRLNRRGPNWTDPEEYLQVPNNGEQDEADEVPKGDATG
jgi:hypothetical protein